MRIALDTNVLAYAEGLGDEPRCRIARDLIARLSIEDIVLPAQVLGELYRVLSGKGARQAAEVRDIALSWADVYSICRLDLGGDG